MLCSFLMGRRRVDWLYCPGSYETDIQAQTFSRETDYAKDYAQIDQTLRNYFFTVCGRVNGMLGLRRLAVAEDWRGDDRDRSGLDARRLPQFDGQADLDHPPSNSGRSWTEIRSWCGSRES